MSLAFTLLVEESADAELDAEHGRWDAEWDGKGSTMQSQLDADFDRTYLVLLSI